MKFFPVTYKLPIVPEEFWPEGHDTPKSFALHAGRIAKMSNDVSVWFSPSGTKQTPSRGAKVTEQARRATVRKVRFSDHISEDVDAEITARTESLWKDPKNRNRQFYERHGETIRRSFGASFRGRKELVHDAVKSAS
jgi:hypothetical protein